MSIRGLLTSLLLHSSIQKANTKIFTPAASHPVYSNGYMDDLAAIVGFDDVVSLVFGLYNDLKLKRFESNFSKFAWASCSTSLNLLDVVNGFVASFAEPNEKVLEFAEKLRSSLHHNPVNGLKLRGALIGRDEFVSDFISRSIDNSIREFTKPL